MDNRDEVQNNMEEGNPRPEDSTQDMEDADTILNAVRNNSLEKFKFHKKEGHIRKDCPIIKKSQAKPASNPNLPANPLVVSSSVDKPSKTLPELSIAFRNTPLANILSLPPPPMAADQDSDDGFTLLPPKVFQEIEDDYCLEVILAMGASKNVDMESSDFDEDPKPEDPAFKRRGRPPGSKNKPVTKKNEIKSTSFTLETNLNYIWNDAIKFFSNHSRGKGGIAVLVNPKWGPLITNHGVSPCQRVVWFTMNINNTHMGFCSIYAPNDPKKRIALWDWLITLPDIPWFFGGDFNMVESQTNKVGGNPFRWKDSENMHWSKFISSKNLFDPLANIKDCNPRIWHTWCNFQQGSDRIYSRLDRFYGNKDYFSFLPDQNGNVVLVTATTLSDHHPIFTRISFHSVPSKQRPTCNKFILNAKLLQDEDVLCAIQIIRNFNHINLKDSSLINIWKANLMSWKSFLQTIGQKFAKDFRFTEKCLNSDLQQAELEVQSDSSNPELLSRVLAAKDALKSIDRLVFNNQEISDPVCITLAFVDYYSNLFSSEDTKEAEAIRMQCKALIPNKLDSVDSLSLSKMIFVDEIIGAIKSLKDDKAPGPDGFSVEFYKANISWISKDLLDIYNEAMRVGTLSSKINRGIIMLLPKDGDKTLIRNWRPITLLNVSYKILAKILAIRLVHILTKIVSATQTGFIKGRYILENLITAWEAMDWATCSHQNVALLLLDFKKAYDRVAWNFIIMMLQSFGFPPYFCNVVQILLSDAFVQVEVNGSLSKPFPLGRSIRQGCPLAPTLFVISAKALYYILRDSTLSPEVRGVYLPNNDELINSQFANDTALFFEIFDSNFLNLQTKLNMFCTISGACISQAKSICLGRDDQPLDWLSQYTYQWGGPNKIVRYLAWMFSNYQILEIQKAIRIFLWSNGKGNRKFHSVNWKWCHTDKTLGGLGLKDLKLQGIALAAKWIFHSLEGDSPWKVLIKHNIERIFPKKACSWKNLPLGDLIVGNFSMVVQGSVIFKSIWHAWEHVRVFITNKEFYNDNYLHGERSIWWNLSINDKPLALYQGCSAKSWARSDIPATCQVNSHRHLKCKWPDGIVLDKLKAKYIYRIIDHNEDILMHINNFWYCSFDGKTWNKLLNYIWKSPVEPKIQCFKWLVLLDRLPIKRDNQSSNICNNCKLPDTGRHILFDCLFAKEIWRLFGIVYPINVNILQIVTGYINGISKDANVFWNILSSNILWQIWKCRNEEKYQGKPRDLTECFRKLTFIKIFLQIQTTMIMEKEKLRKFLKDGQSTFFLYELKYGYQWHRSLDDLRIFESTCWRLNQVIKRNQISRKEETFMLAQIQERKNIVWMEGPQGWTAWVDTFPDVLH
ncbi:uncharacterized protein LOC131858343 [Cryptomeria japonica]|uniref:uncharacterized protein LOC131858343 n=1 Tax=Cryptomeria japonica TaxID=3369 RepID=UPI0027DA1D80|nr:uncharacterized protein LOC131858343 [Cryptomeria japonica]